MKLLRLSTLALALGLLTLGPAAAQAQTGAASEARAPEYHPDPGQAGKDVIWLPTQSTLVDRMLALAKLQASDYLIDLGSGDGRLVIGAAQRGARAHGIEYNPDLVALAQRNAAAAGVAARATFEKADIFESDYSKADVITLFLLPDLNLRLRPTLLRMKPGTRIVSNSFNMGEWEPDDKVQVKESCQTYCDALLWIVPAQVDGRWQLASGELALKQSFQKLEGTLRQGDQTVPISEARMDGTRISFVAGGQRYTGQVDGSRISGQVNGQPWSAVRR